MEQQQLNPLATEFRALLRRKNLTVNGASQRWSISREALTKMFNGNPTTVEIAEKLAKKADEDINKWRVLNGYEALGVPDSEQGRSYSITFGEGYRDMADRLEREGIFVPGRGSAHGGSAGLTPEDALKELTELERVLRMINVKLR